ncbi:centriolar satellite-associated tubulin polyglutamylase complex regulator 1 isoform X1 [Ctenopharyngodon idella]|uniref:centriolar satellite-associated tubulin polyglutamylase complex regulator 1 isoform X1 n=2 Tax=Ctenopharyngodon idella TaxID=7959 RepID=UPI0022325732|nr:centriolar satellite-associated tubulin polyglutamylase complex regulator 1 isoform X1 [Ctenopharyngodon idella]
MKMNTDRFSLTVDEYLAETNVVFYLNDAVTQLLEHKEEYSQFGVVRYFAEYFTSVKNGNHVLFREFSYIKATPHNRETFIHIFWKCFRQIGKNGDLLAMSEYSSLLQLLCPDFPTEMVQNTARIVLTDDATDCLMSFSDFIYSFQIQFYYEEFVESVSMIYEDLLSGKSPNTVIVPTSTSVEQLSSAANEEPDAQEGVDSSIFCECIEGLCERFKHKFPSIVAIKEILESSQRVSFYGFLMALAKHEGVNQDINALPNKSDLLIDPEMDQELERLIAQVAISPTSNNSSSSAAGQKETSKKASPRKSLHQRKRIEMESDGSTEETDSSEN